MPNLRNAREAVAAVAAAAAAAAAAVVPAKFEAPEVATPSIARGKGRRAIVTLALHFGPSFPLCGLVHYYRSLEIGASVARTETVEFLRSAVPSVDSVAGRWLGGGWIVAGRWGRGRS
jgi:hypothetical protein